MKFYVIAQNWRHMGAHSGFPLADVLSKACGANNVVKLVVPTNRDPNLLLWRFSRALGRLLNLLLSRQSRQLIPEHGSPWSTNPHRALAARVISYLDTDHNSVVILASAEDQLCHEFVAIDSSLKKRVFVCVHQPPAWFRLHWPRFEDFDSLGGIICLSQYQAVFFHSICKAPICLIKHGVRHRFYVPPPNYSIRNGNRLIFVGHWLRDFDTLLSAMQLIWKSRPDVVIDCVVPLFARENPSVRRLAMDSRVYWHADLSDHQLCTLYQKADLLFLPIVDAVANNAVVEALSSGLPIVSTNVGAMSEYVSSNLGYLCPEGDVASHAEAALRLLSDSSETLRISRLARDYAIDYFDWGKAAIVIAEFCNTNEPP